MEYFFREERPRRVKDYGVFISNIKVAFVVG